MWNTRVPPSITRQLIIIPCQDQEAGCCIWTPGARSAAWHKYPQSVAPRHPSVLPSILSFLPVHVHILTQQKLRGLAAETRNQPDVGVWKLFA